MISALVCYNESRMSLNTLIQCSPWLATLPAKLPHKVEFEIKE